MSTTALKEDKASRGAPTNLDHKGEKDAESQNSLNLEYSRIGPPVGFSGLEKVDVGTQIELEANAAIQYRTCSWQKVYRT